MAEQRLERRPQKRRNILIGMLGAWLATQSHEHEWALPDDTGASSVETKKPQFVIFPDRDKPIIALPLIKLSSEMKTDQEVIAELDEIWQETVDKHPTRVTAQNWQLIEKEWRSFPEKKITRSIFRHNVIFPLLDAAPSPVRNEDDLKKLFSSATIIIQREPESKNFIVKCVIAELLRSNIRLSALTITDIDQFQIFAGWSNALKYRIERYNFANLPQLVTPQTLTRIEKTLPHPHRYSYFNDESVRGTQIVADYLATLRFDQRHYPARLTSGEEQAVVTATTDLNNAISDTVGESVNGLGLYYLDSLSINGYTPIATDRAPDIIQDLTRLQQLDNKIFEDQLFGWEPAIPPPPQHGLVEVYLQQQDYSQLPQELTGATVQQLLHLVDEIDQVVHLNERQINLLLDRMGQSLRRKLYGEKLSADVLASSYRQLEKAGITAIDDERVEVILFPEKVFEQTYTLVLESANETDQCISIETLFSTPVGLKLFFSLTSIIKHRHITLVDFPKQASLNLGQLDRYIPKANKFITDFVIIDQLSDTIITLTSWEDVALIGEKDWFIGLYKGGGDEFRSFIKNVDISKFPVYSAHYRNLAALPDGLDKIPYSLTQRLLERAEFADVPLTATATNLGDINKQYMMMNTIFGAAAGEAYLDVIQFPEFPTTVSSDTVLEIAADLTLLENNVGWPLAKRYARSFSVEQVQRLWSMPQIITNASIEEEYSKLTCEFYGIGKLEHENVPTFQINLIAPPNIASFIESLTVISMVSAIHAPTGNTMLNDYLNQVDWKNIFSDLSIFDIAYLEKIRLKVNEVTNGTLGDTFLIKTGIQAIEGQSLSLETLDQAVQLAVAFLQSKSDTNIHPDVLPLYQLIGTFQVTRLLEWWSAAGFDLDDKRLASSVKRLQEAGANIPITEGSWQKMLRSWQNPSYVLRKAKVKAESKLSGDVLRTNWRERPITWQQREEELATGFKLQNLRLGNEQLATVVRGNPQQGAMVDYLVRVGGGLTKPVIKDLFRSSWLVADAVGAYTTGASKPAEFVIDNGVVVNFLPSERDGVLLISDRSKIKILHRDAITAQDLDPHEVPTPLAFTRRLEDYYRFINLAEQQQFDMMMGHLLVNNGKIDVTAESSTARDKRRVLATFDDGTFGLVDFTVPMTLYEVAYFLDQVGADNAINLDTGYYDNAAVYTRTGEDLPLGEEDNDGTNNKLVFFSYRERQ